MRHIWRNAFAAISFFIATLISTVALAQDVPMTLGLIPHMAATDMAHRFKPLSDYLSQKIGRSVELKLYKHFEGLMGDIGEGKVDIAFLGPVPYIQITKRYGPVPILARTEISGLTGFHGVIFVRNDSPARTISDLRGAHFASVSRFSTMDLLAQAMMIDVGVPISELPPQQSLGSHQNVALGVLVGDFDAGCVKQDVFDRYADRGLRKLADTSTVPEHIFATNNHMPQQLVQALRQAFLDMNDSAEGRSVMRQVNTEMTAMRPASDPDYDELRRLLSLLEGNLLH
ncbi:phosphate/phosphite/phosphonate ABC transporter substrate-binding protein [Magnetovibrio sp.]|uniref:phosphate/phosphite/phosphonate ABC transporter substrate-binding protein n=1 Tax=Magnetovibrio sp. TaxID=2024836 RepID=UPI002F91C793